jgi:hypothetical protein
LKLGTEEIKERICPIRLAIHYTNHKVQQKDTYCTGTLRVQGSGVNKNLDENKRMEIAVGWEELEGAKGLT